MNDTYTNDLEQYLESERLRIKSKSEQRLEIIHKMCMYCVDKLTNAEYLELLAIAYPEEKHENHD